MYKIIILILISYFTSNAQSIEFEKLIKVDSIENKEILFNRLSSKLIEHIGGQDKYNKSILQSDKELGLIKFKQAINYDPKGNRSDDGEIKFNVSVYFKDGRYKIILSEFYHEGKGISLYQITDEEEYPNGKNNFLNFRKKAWKEIKSYINDYVPNYFILIEKLLHNPTELEKKW
jgi:hypothetical protein